MSIENIEQIINQKLNNALDSKFTDIQRFKDDISQRIGTVNSYSLEKYNKLKQSLIDEIERFKLMQDQKLEKSIQRDVNTELKHQQQDVQLRQMREDLENFKDLMIQNIDAVLEGEHLKESLFESFKAHIGENDHNQNI